MPYTKQNNIKGALCSLRRKNKNFNIYNNNEVTTQTQKHVCFP